MYSTYAGTASPLWLGYAPCCPSPCCPNFVSWSPDGLDGKKERKRIEISVLISNPKQEENSEKKTDEELDEG